MLKLACVLLIFALLSSNSSVFADEVPVSESTSTRESTWHLLKEKLRIRTFTEVMSPAFQEHGTSVPDLNGTDLAPTNLFTIAWADYEITPNYRVFFWQRFMLFLANDPTTSAGSISPRNPRFGIRRTNLFKNPNISTTYDLYVQPGLAPESMSQGRSLEVGFRTNTSYTIPNSKWSIGEVTELNASFSDHGGPGSNAYGWSMSWASYEFSKPFATEHFLTFNFMQQRGDSWSQIQWDYPKPYIQNGIGVNVTDKVWAALFLNNYILEAPTLGNTWTSFWLSLEFL